MTRVLQGRGKCVLQRLGQDPVLARQAQGLLQVKRFSTPATVSDPSYAARNSSHHPRQTPWLHPTSRVYLHWTCHEQLRPHAGESNPQNNQLYAIQKSIFEKNAITDSKQVDHSVKNAVACKTNCVRHAVHQLSDADYPFTNLPPQPFTNLPPHPPPTYHPNPSPTYHPNPSSTYCVQA
jgi:hypothetical protein